MYKNALLSQIKCFKSAINRVRRKLVKEKTKERDLKQPIKESYSFADEFDELFGDDLLTEDFDF